MTVNRATKVVAISGAVARDLADVYGSSIAGRIATIPNPIDWGRFESHSADDSVPLGGRPYLLSVAAEWPHKNLRTLLRAYEARQTEMDGCALVLVGQTREALRGYTTRMQPSAAEIIGRRELQRNVFQTGHICDAELGRLYRHARGFVFPSLFEGFGMPPVEALGMGLPVITTRCGAIPETTHELATYVRDPLDVQELASTLVTMVHDPGRFSPSPANVHALRLFYDPRRIAQLYLEAALN